MRRELTYYRHAVEGICRGCMIPTRYYIDGQYPVCERCMLDLIDNARHEITSAEGWTDPRPKKIEAIPERGG